MRLYPEECPRTVENFTTHCRNGYYDNLIFHRVIRGFMIQTGDPLGDGTGGQSIWGREFEDEFHKRYIWFLILFRIFPCSWMWVSSMAVSQHAFKFWPFSAYFYIFPSHLSHHDFSMSFFGTGLNNHYQLKILFMLLSTAVALAFYHIRSHVHKDLAVNAVWDMTDHSRFQWLMLGQTPMAPNFLLPLLPLHG